MLLLEVKSEYIRDGRKLKLKPKETTMTKLEQLIEICKERLTDSDLNNLHMLRSELDDLKNPEKTLSILDYDDFDLIFNALNKDLAEINEVDQINLLKQFLKNETCTHHNIEGLNSMLHDIDKPWIVIHQDEAVKIKNALKDLTDNILFLEEPLVERGL